MIVAGSTNPLLLASAGGYNLTRSLRFRSSASAYLNRTPASAGNLRTWTWSAWVKRGELGNKNLFACTSTQHYIGFNGGNGLNFQYDAGGVNDYKIFTNQVFRDPSAWYHIVAVWDTTNATSSSRMRLYVNGEQITSLSASNYPPQNYDGSINSTNAHSLGSYGTASYFDGYLTEVNFIDGQALTPSSFGETDVATGVWKPKRYTGTYGTNGFYLNFTDNSAATAAAIGKDSSGNGNNWTPNNISVTAGATYDSMTDVPTLTSATAANFAVLNPLISNSLGTTSGSIINGNLRLSTSTVNSLARSTMPYPSSGKFYSEVTITNNGGGAIPIGISTPFSTSFAGFNPSVSYRANGVIEENGSTVVSGLAGFTTGDIIGVAVNMTDGQVSWYKNNTLIATRTNVATLFGTNDIVLGGQTNSTNSTTIDFNFGQRPFAYTPPTGYVALNTFNLPTPTIGATASSQANKYFDATTYTGNGSSGKAVTNAGAFSPDFVWIKDRTSANYHGLFDRLRGAGYALYSNGTFTESAFNAQTLQSLDASGFTVGTNGDFNTNNNAYVGWQWKANGTGVTNTAGSITSTVSANTTSGFSVVTYTGNGSSGTVGHGLGVAPKMIIVKNRSTTADWPVYVGGVTSATEVMRLNSTTAKLTGRSEWNSTLPTSTVFSVGNDSAVNTNGNNYVAYCFAEVAGFSKFGSYVSNNSTDGPFVYCGFKPRWIMFKLSDAVGSWVIQDTVRGTTNVIGNPLYPNLSNAEGSAASQVDVLSNGFKLRAASNINENTSTVIYAAFSENPFKYSLAR